MILIVLRPFSFGRNITDNVIITYFSCLCFRELQDGEVALQVHTGEEATPLLLKVNQVLKIQQTSPRSEDVTVMFIY